MSSLPALTIGGGPWRRERPTAGRQGLEGGVATAAPEATEAALEILRFGGNAVDAAVAAAWALSVCEPSGSGLGGQTTMLFYRGEGDLRVIDGHSSAPAAVSLETVSPQQQRVGHRACTVPSTPATLAYAQRKYGVLTRERVLAPAIRIAEKGYPISRLQHRQARWVAASLRLSPATSGLFLGDGMPLPVGHVFRQPCLAETLRRLAGHGVEDFYRGRMAEAIAEDMRLHDGLLDEQDLAACALPVEREPIFVSYRGFHVASVPPPGGGLQVLLALKILERLLPSNVIPGSEDWYEAVARATYASFRDRENLPLRPADFTAEIRRWFFDEERLREAAAELPDLVSTGPERASAETAGETTHLTAADGAGNIVALTQSIQSVFGAKVANPRLGFLYNNYLRSCRRGPHVNGLAGNCLPQSNAAPTLVFRDTPRGRIPCLALGAAGSRRITSSIVQVISSVIDRGLTAMDAVAAPRIHALLSRKIWIEEAAAGPRLLDRLSQDFRRIKVKPSRSYKMGSVQALQWSPTGTVLGAADPRRDGSVAAFPEARRQEKP